MQYVADLFTRTVCRAVEERGACNIALAGGTTPHALYEHLGDSVGDCVIPWQNVNVFFGDERDVPQDNVESNYNMAQRTLLDHVPVRPENIHPMPADAGDLQAAAMDYENLIRSRVPAGDSGVPSFDLIMLGMGGDGHTASLFPGECSGNNPDQLVMARFIPILGRHRMTVTFNLINAARSVIVMVVGADKAEAVSRLFGDDDTARIDLPVANLDPGEGRLSFVLDMAAARLSNTSIR